MFYPSHVLSYFCSSGVLGRSQLTNIIIFVGSMLLCEELFPFITFFWTYFGHQTLNLSKYMFIFPPNNFLEKISNYGNKIESGFKQPHLCKFTLPKSGVFDDSFVIDDVGVVLVKILQTSIGVTQL